MQHHDNGQSTVITDSGNIDFTYYDRRARQLRSASVADMFRALWTRRPTPDRGATGAIACHPCT